MFPRGQQMGEVGREVAWLWSTAHAVLGPGGITLAEERVGLSGQLKAIQTPVAEKQTDQNHLRIRKSHELLQQAHVKITFTFITTTNYENN